MCAQHTEVREQAQTTQNASCDDQYCQSDEQRGGGSEKCPFDERGSLALGGVAPQQAPA